MLMRSYGVYKPGARFYTAFKLKKYRRIGLKYINQNDTHVADDMI